jgi:predicted outer membrane repeat protein
VISSTTTGANGGAILNPGILLLEGNTFQENYSNLVDPASRGGAIWSSGLLIIQGSQFIGNLANAGGAIYARREVDTTSLTITGAAFHRNRALGGPTDGNGGALLIDNLAATVQASTFISNGATSGGAIYLGASGVLTLTNSTLHNNSDPSGASLYNKPTASLSSGAGLYNKGTAHLTNVTLSANNATEGSGIVNYGLLFLTNVTLSGNIAAEDFGALRNEAGGTARLSNVTLSGNAGGGIMNFTPDTHLNLTNVIVADSPRGDNCAFYTPPDLSQFNLSSDNTCNFGAGRNNLDLRLGPLANNGGSTQTHLPRCSSPAIENGTDDDAPSVDQRGFGRPQGTFYDVGSVEVRPAEGMQCLYLPLILR